MRQSYIFDQRDAELLWSANVLLRKVVAGPRTRPGQLVSVAKLLHVLSVLPRVTEGLNVSVSVTSPRQKFDEVETYHYWDVVVEDDELKVSTGGHFYQRSTGGDTFTTMRWTAIPGHCTELKDHSESLWMVPDLRSYSEGVEGIDLTSNGYNIEIVDHDNPLLYPVEDDNDDEQTP
jgi:hypothetical protein